MAKRSSISVILCFLSFILIESGNWLVKTFGDVAFEQYLFYLFGPKDGTNTNIFGQYFLECFLKVVLWTVLFAVIYFVLLRIFHSVRTSLKIRLGRRYLRWNLSFSTLVLIGSILFFVTSGFVFSNTVGLHDYLVNQTSFSTIYEDYYVDPNGKVTFPEEKRNVIIIYMESMESTYSASSSGGAEDVDYIPRLTELATDNVQFSNTDQMGGAFILPGTGWTTAALVSSSSGMGLMVPLDYNATTTYNKFLPNAITLGDVLDEAGYNQVFMIGSDADFGGRSTYFRLHGDYTIYDYKTAIEEGLIPEDYYVWWGYEDSKLFEFAKDKLLELASQDEPFNFTLLTADTHFVGGYLDPSCEEPYDDQFKNVLLCSSNMIYDFVRWIQEQDFYENTTIVLTGDHQTMDNVWITEYVPENFNRTVYNAFINSAVEPVNEKNRLFSSYDMYPTILASMGATIEGDRLGLGTNLFSSQETLIEQLGYSELYAELEKNSKFYNREFIYSN